MPIYAIEVAFFFLVQFREGSVIVGQKTVFFSFLAFIQQVY